LTKAVEALVKSGDDEGNDDEEHNDEEHDDISLPSLGELFTVGQWVRVAIVENTAISGPSDKTNKKHIELSLEPELVNASISADDVLPKTLFQVSVSSIEDHGIIVSLGLPNLTGFIKKSSLGPYKTENIRAGQVFLACVEHKPKNNVVQLSLSLSASQTPIADVSDITSLLPGDTVKCLISEARAIGAGGKVLGMLDATIDKLHIGDASVSENKNVFSHGM
jgi:rRNA biogenesis protein RRP5